MTPWRPAVQRGTVCRDLRGFGAVESKACGEPAGAPKAFSFASRLLLRSAVQEDHPCCRQPGPCRSMLRRVQVVHRGHRIGRIAPRKYSTLQPANDSVNGGLERHDYLRHSVTPANVKARLSPNASGQARPALPLPLQGATFLLRRTGARGLITPPPRSRQAFLKKRGPGLKLPGALLSTDAFTGGSALFTKSEGG